MISIVASTCRTSLAIWIVLTQSSIVSVPRKPMIIFDETVVAGTILFLTPLLKSAVPHSQAFASFENNHERGRAQQLKKFGSTAGRVLSPRSSLPAHPLSVGLGRANRPDLPVRVESRVKSSRGSAGSFSTGLRVGIADWFELLREHQQVSYPSRWGARRIARPTVPVLRIAGSRSMSPAPLAEAALRGHIGERQPVIAQLFLGQHDALLN
jgi:hypothetical protein